MLRKQSNKSEKGSTIAWITVVFIVLSMFAAAGCQKDNEESDGTATIKATAGATSVQAAKTTAKTGGSATAAKASGTAGSTAGISGTAGQQAADRTDEVSGQTEGTGENNGAETDEEDQQGQGNDIYEGVDIIEGDDFIAGNKKIDLGGKNIYVAWGIKNRAPKEDSTDTKLKILWSNAKELEEKYNCKFVFEEIITGYLNTVIQNGLAGTEYRNLLFSPNYSMYPAVADQGLLLALEPYIPQDTDMWSDQVAGLTEWRGRHYGMAETGNMYGGQNHIYYDQTIMSREGIDIWKHVQDSQWNWATFLDVAQQTTKDLNGDGIIDQWGLLARTQYLGEGLIYANGGSYIEKKDGKYVLALNSPQAVQALQFMSDLCNVYKVTKKITSDSQIKPLKGFYAMTLTHIGSLATFYPDPVMGGDVWMAPIPKGPYMDNHITGYRIYQDMFALAANLADDPQRVQVCCEWMRMTYLGMKATNPLKTSSSIWYKNMPQENIERILWLQDTGLGKNDTLVNVFALATYAVTNIYNKVIDLETPVTSALAANEGVMQGMIDEKMGY